MDNDSLGSETEIEDEHVKKENILLLEKARLRKLKKDKVRQLKDEKRFKKLLENEYQKLHTTHKNMPVSDTKSVYDISARSESMLQKHKNAIKKMQTVIEAKDVTYGYGVSVIKNEPGDLFYIKYAGFRVPFTANYEFSKDRNLIYILTSLPLYLWENNKTTIYDTYACFKIKFDIERKISKIEHFMPHEYGCKKNIPPYIYMSLADFMNQKFKIRRCVLDDAATVNIDKKIVSRFDGSRENAAYVPLSLITLLIHEKTYYERYGFTPTKKSQQKINKFLLFLKSTLNFEKLQELLLNFKNLKSNEEKLKVCDTLNDIWEKKYKKRIIKMTKSFVYK